MESPKMTLEESNDYDPRDAGRNLMDVLTLYTDGFCYLVSGVALKLKDLRPWRDQSE